MAGSAAHDAGSGVRDISELLGREPHTLLCRATNARMVGERATDRSHREIEPLSDVFYCDHGVRLVLPQNSSIVERGTYFHIRQSHRRAHRQRSLTPCLASE